jgi:hypothetical protein
VGSESTVSPYLNLHRSEENSEGAPNYFSFVRPQLEQQEAQRRQQLEIQRLQRQVQGGPPAVATPQYDGASAPKTSRAARFMDTAQFYRGW